MSKNGGVKMIGYISKRDWELLKAGKTTMPMILDEAGVKQWKDHLDHCGGVVRIAIIENDWDEFKKDVAASLSETNVTTADLDMTDKHGRGKG